MRWLLWLCCGVIFALGLGVSGMTQPSKVVGFLNVMGAWDPSLALVMVGAIGVHFVGYMVRKKMTRPIAAARFEVPTRGDISWRLLLGAALFGLGWGMAGYCPGPALVSMTSGSLTPIYFVLAMSVGMVVHYRLVPKEISADVDVEAGS